MVCKDEITKHVGASRDQSGVHAVVESDIEEMFAGKSSRALEKTRTDIERKIESSHKQVDTDYWESLLKHLQVYHAKAILKEVHQLMLGRQLERLEAKRAELERIKAERARLRAEGLLEEEDEKEEEEEEDVAHANVDESAEAAAMMAAERNKGLDQNEETLGATEEVDLTGQVYWWHDRYRPRRPRYYNRVKTGYDWNKFNQTHYDHDNPPPKTVQGYKFNIFYPDLIDRTKAPTYVLEAADSPEFAIIRFNAGPPYEDIAFKIVNREWEHSRKHGFKCMFERGILHLYFNFKRMRYRR